MTLRASLLLSAALLLTACQHAQPAPPQAAPSAPATSAPAESLTTAPALPPCPEDDDGCRVDRLGDTALGWLKDGITADALLARLGEPAEREERFEEGATGAFVEIWRWPDHGVVAQVLAPDMTSPITDARAFTVTAPFDQKTARGVGLGDSEAAVLRAYADCLDLRVTHPGQSAVAGSVYGGVFFTFTDGVVTEIFVGAGAE